MDSTKSAGDAVRVTVRDPGSGAGGGVTAGLGEQWSGGDRNAVTVNLSRPLPVEKCGQLQLSVALGSGREAQGELLKTRPAFAPAAWGYGGEPPGYGRGYTKWYMQVSVEGVFEGGGKRTLLPRTRQTYNLVRESTPGREGNVRVVIPVRCP